MKATVGSKMELVLLALHHQLLLHPIRINNSTRSPVGLVGGLSRLNAATRSIEKLYLASLMSVFSFASPSTGGTIPPDILL